MNPVGFRWPGFLIMSTALTILKKIESINVLYAAQESIKRTSERMVAIQKDQLFQGIRPDGDDVFPPYRPLTIYLKEQKGQPTDRVTRKDTGKYYAGIKVDVTGEKYEIKSTDSKAGSLNKKYGDIGLSKASRIIYVHALRPEFIKNIKAYLK